jgi:protocatechuate 3,4-dioxygenase beta subunit
MKQPNIVRRRLLAGLVLMSNPLRAALTMTPPSTEGPFYPSEDMRLADIDADLVRNEAEIRRAGGEIVMLGGRVLDHAGDPVTGARVEIWQCDVQGRYLHHGDVGGYPGNASFQGFGFSRTDDKGRYRFRTIKPVPYPGRTPHIHLKVMFQQNERLTTQLYLPDHPQNEGDFIYRSIPTAKRPQVTMYFRKTDLYPEATLDLVIA